MAITSLSCCLNQLPPPCQGSNYSSSSSKTNQVQVLPWNKSDGSWRSRCVLGMTCVVVGLEMGSALVGGKISQEAMAKGVAAPVAMESSEIVVNWSDRGICPKWSPNELEIIVPEKLPRPSAHRRWEFVGSRLGTKDAPAVKMVITRSSGGCFSV